MGRQHDRRLTPVERLAYPVRRIERAEKAEAILLRSQAIHPNVAMIACFPATWAVILEGRGFLQSPPIGANVVRRPVSAIRRIVALSRRARGCTSTIQT